MAVGSQSLGGSPLGGLLGAVVIRPSAVDGYLSLSSPLIDTQQLHCYSEDTIKTQGAYSLKCVAGTNTLNDKLRHVFTGDGG